MYLLHDVTCVDISVFVKVCFIVKKKLINVLKVIIISLLIFIIICYVIIEYFYCYYMIKEISDFYETFIHTHSSEFEGGYYFSTYY